MPEDLLNGFNAGLGLADRYAGAKQQAFVNARTDQFHNDALGIQQSQLDLEGQRTAALKKQIESEVAIRDKLFEWQDQQRAQRKREFGALVELDKQVNDWMMQPLDPTTAPAMLDTFKRYSYLTSSDDPLVKSDATALRDKALKHFQNSVAFPVLEDQTRQIANGFLSKDQLGNPAAVQTAKLAQDASDARTLAASQGVDLNSGRYDDLMSGLTINKATGGYTDESKAKIKRAIESEAASAQRALPDKESKFKLGFGKYDKYSGKYSNEATLSLQDVLSNPEIQKQVQSILQSQGTTQKDSETFTGTASDEAGKPRVTQNGHTFRWSQSAGRYVYMGPVASLSPTESPLPIAPR